MQMTTTPGAPGENHLREQSQHTKLQETITLCCFQPLSFGVVVCVCEYYYMYYLAKIKSIFPDGAKCVMCSMYFIPH